MNKPTKTPKHDSFKTWLAWGKNAFDLLRAQSVGLGASALEMNRKVDAMVMERAYAESMDKPKIHLRYEYPLALFFNNEGAGPYLDGFERSLPACVEVSKLFIPFADGSVMLLQSPSEETVQCGLYVKMLCENPVVADFMGADAERLGALREVVDLVATSPRVAALSTDDISKFLAREAAVARLGRGPSVRVNMSANNFPAEEALEVLMAFFRQPSDTVMHSVQRFLHEEFASPGTR